MDKKLWLKVIKDELTLLDELATGMISDDSLSREEVELAISRSKIVVREFEMLLNQLSKQASAISMDRVSVTQEMADSFAPPLVESPSPTVVPSSPHPLVESPSLPASQSPSPPVVESSPRPLVESPSLPVSESPSPPFVESSPRPLIESSTIPLVPSALPTDEREEYTQYFKIEPLKSLKEGLSLNDRYLFQRELFNNDKSSLDEAVAALDRLSNLKEAVEYMKANFKWNKSEAADKFITLIKRRFSEPKG